MSYSLKSTAIQLFVERRNIKSALLVLCEGNLPTTGEVPSQRDSNAIFSILWCHHGVTGRKCVEYNISICDMYFNYLISKLNLMWDILWDLHNARDMRPRLHTLHLKQGFSSCTILLWSFMPDSDWNVAPHFSHVTFSLCNKIMRWWIP